MHKEHHMYVKSTPEVNATECQLILIANRDSFDLASFFQLHDLNRDGNWDKDEIEAVYGMHHEYSKALSPNEQVQKERAEAVVKAVLDKVTTGSFRLHLPLGLTLPFQIDTNRNGLIDQKEFEAAGWKGLESFKGVGADGHHYDVESGKWSWVDHSPRTGALIYCHRVLSPS
jgi:hypothetical protein